MVEHIEAVRRMQVYIADHIKEPITLNELAKVSHYSPWYSSRIFKTYLDKSPFDYIRERRLSLAALDIRDSERPIIDVALDFVFDSHSGFTRAFTRSFGLTPLTYRKDYPPIELFLPYLANDFSSKGAEQVMSTSQDVQTIFTQVIDKPARKLILLRGQRATHYFEYCDEVGCEVWGVLSSIKEALGEPMGIWLPEQMIPSGTSSYVQGVEVPLEYDKSLPDGYEMIELPAEKVMIFQGEPYDDAYFESAIQSFQQSVLKFNPHIYGFEYDPKGMSFQLEPQGYRGYMEGKTVITLN